MRNDGGQKFSTRDQDNDAHDIAHYAMSDKGAWWWGTQISCNLNGLYLRGRYSASRAEGVGWGYWKGLDYSLRFTEMKFKPF